MSSPSSSREKVKILLKRTRTFIFMTFPLNDSLRNNTEEAHIPFFHHVCFLFQVFSSLLIVSTRQISSIISASNINRAPRNGFSVFPSINYTLKIFLHIISPRTIWTDSVLGHIFIIKFLHRPLGLSHSTLINIILFPLFSASPKGQSNNYWAKQRPNQTFTCPFPFIDNQCPILLHCHPTTSYPRPQLLLFQTRNSEMIY